MEDTLTPAVFDSVGGLGTVDIVGVKSNMGMISRKRKGNDGMEEMDIVCARNKCTVHAASGCSYSFDSKLLVLSLRSRVKGQLVK